MLQALVLSLLAVAMVVVSLVGIIAWRDVLRALKNRMGQY